MSNPVNDNFRELMHELFCDGCLYSQPNDNKHCYGKRDGCHCDCIDKPNPNHKWADLPECDEGERDE